MPTLILLRHAKAVRDHEAPSDEARALTARGIADATKAGQEIAALGLGPQVALVSAAIRTRQTWAALAPALPNCAPQFESALYLAPMQRIWASARGALTAHDSVLVIGHNPGLHDLIAELVAQTHDHSRPALALIEHLPTAAFAAFAIEGDVVEAAAPRLLAAWQPKD
jgi:phosphohistidine phosphatase